jgi:predicted transcriptional regulator
MELEEVFSSKLRVRILKLLNKLPSLNVSDIARRLSSNFASTAENLKILTAEGILLEHAYGRVRMYRFNEASPKAKAVKALIEAWEQKS